MCLSLTQQIREGFQGRGRTGEIIWSHRTWGNWCGCGVSNTGKTETWEHSNWTMLAKQRCHKSLPSVALMGQKWSCLIQLCLAHSAKAKLQHWRNSKGMTHVYTLHMIHHEHCCYCTDKILSMSACFQICQAPKGISKIDWSAYI